VTADRHRDALHAAFTQLESLRRFSGAPGEFWGAFLDVVLLLASATDAVLLSRTHGPEGAGPWKDLASKPVESALGSDLRASRGDFERLALTAEGDGFAENPGRRWAAVRLESGDAGRTAVLVAKLGADAETEESLVRLRLVADAPLLFQAGRTLEQTRQDAGRFAVTLDLLVLLNAQTRFTAAAMTLCNEVAARFSAERVTLGWLKLQAVRVQAISHTEHFGEKMGVVVALEAAMDECVDQDEEICWPAPAESRAICAAHEELVRAEACSHVLSLPLRLGGEVIGAVLLERSSSAFSLRETQTLRLLCDQVARRLHDLHRHDRWLGARAATALREQAAKWIGYEHTWAKLGVIAVAIALLVLIFGHAEYRIESPFELKADVVSQVPAPFDGFIEEVHFRVGEHVHAGQPLVTLDTRELILQEAAASAERQQHLGEAQKAEAENDAAAMQIANATAEAAKARLDIARHHLAQAKLTAPFDGVVVEGDLRERLAAPVKQGDVLVKIVRLDALYAELALPERHVHEVNSGQAGELAFTARPALAFPIKLESLEPVAEARENGNVFILRGTFTSREPWWRPGMSGVAKIDVGSRNLFWIVSHRTVDFLRLYFWW
jgi:RND family efflux transporter MFP subunit